MAGVRPVRMEDIAARVGVSRTAVSFVLNDRADASISDAIRAKIIQVANELGYRPHAGARALAAQRSGLIGMITEVITSPFGPGVIRGAQDAAWGAGKFLLIAATEGRRKLEEFAIDRLLQQRVEGLIYASGFHREVVLPAAMLELPTVLVHCFDAKGRRPAVVPDESLGGYRATRRLLEAGHRRIGLVNLERRRKAAKGRRQGYIKALSEFHVAVDESLIAHASATAGGGYEASGELLDLADPPTALFCCTDRMAMGAYDAIRERGLRIPDDVSVVGFDNQELIAAYLRPGLTTVALPYLEMGARSVELLDLMLADKDVPVRTIMDCPLVERSSVA
jgi:LacI family transcriptional regulator